MPRYAIVIPKLMPNPGNMFFLFVYRAPAVLIFYTSSSFYFLYN
ncbi:hypothetical protein CHCC20335_1661 [Bacillus paralicheniformis]|nr:hypothetical protein CHCC20335_1661 [Bacillus paralicheniformis]